VPPGQARRRAGSRFAVSRHAPVIAARGTRRRASRYDRIAVKGHKPMSRIPNSAIPHAWAEDSDHAREVRRARGEEPPRARSVLAVAAAVGAAAFGLGLLFRRLRHA
jgi:hypothetical protein